MPRFSEDDVVDYLVTEAVVTHAGRSEQEKQKQAERDAWKKDRGPWARREGLLPDGA